MTTSQDVKNALEKIDAPDNNENDRMAEVDNAIRLMRQLPEAEQLKLARQEFDRFLKWLRSRRP